MTVVLKALRYSARTVEPKILELVLFLSNGTGGGPLLRRLLRLIGLLLGNSLRHRLLATGGIIRDVHRDLDVLDLPVEVVCLLQFVGTPHKIPRHRDLITDFAIHNGLLV